MNKYYKKKKKYYSGSDFETLFLIIFGGSVVVVDKYFDRITEGEFKKEIDKGYLEIGYRTSAECSYYEKVGE